MTQSAAGGAADTCYRHPDRQSWVLCQRCGRTICHECQIPAAVGVQCPECVREAAASAKDAQRANRRAAGVRAPQWVRGWLGGASPVTLAIIALTAIVGVLQVFSGGSVTNLLLFWEPAALVQPWRILTVVLVHGGILHFAFNMLTLFMVGPAIEQRLGRLPFLAAYLALAIAGDLGVALLAPMSAVVGASGAIFGLFGLYLGMQRALGGVNVQLVVVVAINLVIGFVAGGVAWQAHVGGLIAGLILGFVIARLSGRQRISESVATWTPIAIVGGLSLAGVLAIAARYTVA